MLGSPVDPGLIPRSVSGLFTSLQRLVLLNSGDEEALAMLG